jgi:hypothetical protein
VNENPWHRLPDKPPFVLPEDMAKVEAFNLKEEQKAGQNHVLNLDLIPEAFLGWREAPLVLLGNIAGVSETGDPPAAYRLEREFADRMRNNLLDNKAHRNSNCPFVYFEPEIIPPGEDWWDCKLRYLLREFGNADVAKSILARNILAVEFFPYVSCSNRYAHDSLRLPSQEYSFDLVRNAVKREAVIVLRHGERRWLEAVRELDGYQRLVRLKIYLKGLISPNLVRDDGWSHIREVVRKIEVRER